MNLDDYLMWIWSGSYRSGRRMWDEFWGEMCQLNYFAAWKLNVNCALKTGRWQIKQSTFQHLEKKINYWIPWSYAWSCWL